MYRKTPAKTYNATNWLGEIIRLIFEFSSQTIKATILKRAKLIISMALILLRALLCWSFSAFFLKKDVSTIQLGTWIRFSRCDKICIYELSSWDWQQKHQGKKWVPNFKLHFLQYEKRIQRYKATQAVPSIRYWCRVVAVKELD